MSSFPGSGLQRPAHNPPSRSYRHTLEKKKAYRHRSRKRTSPSRSTPATGLHAVNFFPIREAKPRAAATAELHRRRLNTDGKSRVFEASAKHVSKPLPFRQPNTGSIAPLGVHDQRGANPDVEVHRHRGHSFTSKGGRGGRLQEKAVGIEFYNVGRKFFHNWREQRRTIMRPVVPKSKNVSLNKMLQEERYEYQG